MTGPDRKRPPHSRVWQEGRPRLAVLRDLQYHLGKGKPMLHRFPFVINRGGKAYTAFFDNHTNTLIVLCVIIKERKDEMRSLQEFQKKIGYSFQNEKLLKEALTHTSYINENRRKKLKPNERLEFLGDSILGVVVSTYLFKNRIDLPEGELSKIRAAIVCEESLHQVAEKIDVGIYLYMGKGEEMTGGRQRSSILADVIEAVIAAIYLDGGMKAAREFIFAQMQDIIDNATRGNLDKDYKTQLQELIQRQPGKTLEYRLIGEKGPDHCKFFTVELLVDGKQAGVGEGRSKKEAEKQAAKATLERMNEQ